MAEQISGFLGPAKDMWDPYIASVAGTSARRGWQDRFDSFMGPSIWEMRGPDAAERKQTLKAAGDGCLARPLRVAPESGLDGTERTARSSRN